MKENICSRKHYKAILKAVSYTHLDVYKRQGNNLAVPLELPTTTTKPEALDIELAYDEKTFAPLPFSMPTARPTASPSASPAESATPSNSKRADTFCTLTICGKDIPVRYGVDEKTCLLYTSLFRA